MKINNKNLIRFNGLHRVFPCNTFDEYISLVGKNFDTSTGYGNYLEYLKDAFDIFIEALVKFTPRKIGVFSSDYVNGDKVLMIGKNKMGETATISSVFAFGKRDITYSEDISPYYVESINSFNVSPKNKNSLFLITNTEKITDRMLKEVPVAKNKINFITVSDIKKIVDNNDLFWKEFEDSIVTENINISRAISIDTLKLRDFQEECVSVLINSSVGKIILPCGTGKGLIESEYVARVSKVRSVEGFVVFYVFVPRIMLATQILNVIFRQMIGNGIHAQYVCFHSGEMEDESKEMYHQMISHGFSPKEIVSTTSISDVREKAKKAKEEKCPLVVCGTYHSGWKLEKLGLEVDTILHDEAHNLIVGRFSEDFKEDIVKMTSNNKFFFTATPVETPSDKGNGFNNIGVFGENIYSKSYCEMISRGEILKILLHPVYIKESKVLKNQKKKDESLNQKEVDFNRDVESKAKAILDSFFAHELEVKKNSAFPSMIDAKIIVTVDNVPQLKGILESPYIKLLIDQNIEVMAICTDLCYFRNGEWNKKSNFKDKFQSDLTKLKSNDRAVILHIDMIGEGIDVPSVTGVMAFSIQGTVKMIQLLGRPMRLHEYDRKRLYNGEFYKNMDREKLMVKPYSYLIIPMFLRDSNDMYAEVKGYLNLIHSAYDYIPNVLHIPPMGPPGGENIKDEEINTIHEKFKVLEFKHEIEAIGFEYCMKDYIPDPTL